MTAEDLKVFVSGTENFFAKVTSQRAEVSTPFVKDDTENVMYDFSAVIGVSGAQRGSVYFSAPRPMMQKLVSAVGEPELSDENCADYVGEIANTISGNAREQLGTNFMISVPTIFQGNANAARFPTGVPAYVVPIVWSGHRSSLVICLRDVPQAIREKITPNVDGEE